MDASLFQRHNQICKNHNISDTNNSKMSSEFFTVEEHIVPCQHIREGFMTTSPDDPGWRMQVKQYTPRNNPSPKEGDITILSSHANGFPVVKPPHPYLHLTPH